MHVLPIWRRMDRAVKSGRKLLHTSRSTKAAWACTGPVPLPETGACMVPEAKGRRREMSRCETCEHYEYRAGISPSLAALCRIHDAPTAPTCICHYAKCAWTRTGATVRKPTYMPCDYKARLFTCTDCGTHNTRGALILSSARGEMVCKKCCQKSYEESLKNEAGDPHV